MTSFRRFLVALAFAPVIAHAQSWPHLAIDERLTPNLEGIIRVPVLPAPTLTLPVASGSELCTTAYVFCTPPLTCPSELGLGSNFELGNPLTGIETAQYQEADVTVMGGGECYGQGTQQHLRFGFPSPPVFTGVEGCLACAFELWEALRGDAVCPTSCVDTEFLGPFCALFGGSGNVSFGPQAAATGPTRLDTLRALRDQHLVNSAAGRRWIMLYDTHSPSLARVLWSHPGLGISIGKAFETWLPALAALVAGQGSGVTITPAMMDAWLAILDEFFANAPTDTQAAIAAERALLGLPSFVGLTMDAALARFQADGAAGCGGGFAGADCELATLAADDLCGADPIEPGVLQLAEQRVRAARHLLARAESSMKAKTQKKLVARAARQLDAMARRVRHAKKTSTACRTTIADLLSTRRAMVAALAP